MLMLDSGAHSLYKAYTKKHHSNDFSFYESDEFWSYVDKYAEFIKKNIDVLSVYVNVDVIFNPELSWKVQKYLEDIHKLHPLPVFHSYEDFKWLHKYIDNYEYIGIGGIGQTVGRNTWIKSMGDPIFNIICDTPNRLPRVKVHGFAIGSPELIVRYPFFSVDSASWVIYGKYGGIIVPKKRKGKYDYSIAPYLLKTSWRNWHINKEGTHIDNVTSIQRVEFIRYFEERGFCLGESEYKSVPQGYQLKENEQWVDRKKRTEIEIIIKSGLCNDYEQRDHLNLLYFLDMERQVPEYPWPWSTKVRRLI